MRRAFLLLLCAIAALPAMQVNVVPLDAVQWNSDSPQPSTAGIARRSQIYMIIDFSNDDGKKLFNVLRNSIKDPALGKNFDQIHFLLAADGSLDPRQEEDPVEYWCKGIPQNPGLARAFCGDYYAALIIINGTGRVTSISRLSGSLRTYEKSIKDARKNCNPLVNDPSVFPLACKKSLDWLRLADTNRAMKEVQKAGPDAPNFIKLVTERINLLIDEDAKLLTNMTKTPSERLIAYHRLQGLIQDMPSAPAVKNAQVALKGIKDDNDLKKELEAFALLGEYMNVMRKTSAKKSPEVQTQWLGSINQKFGGTYAAEIATMIKKCSQIQ
jgi:hypothetical protein